MVINVYNRTDIATNIFVYFHKLKILHSCVNRKLSFLNKFQMFSESLCVEFVNAIQFFTHSCVHLKFHSFTIIQPRCLIFFLFCLCFALYFWIVRFSLLFVMYLLWYFLSIFVLFLLYFPLLFFRHSTRNATLKKKCILYTHLNGKWQNVKDCVCNINGDTITISIHFDVYAVFLLFLDKTKKKEENCLLLIFTML